MKDPKGQARPEQACPECGAPRTADNTPSCVCGPRASEALRDARTAEAAAAEDFNPLRIRPYVELGGAGDSGVAGAGAAAGQAAAGTEAGNAGERETRQTPAGEPTMPLRAVPPDPTAAPNAADLSLFEPGGGVGGPDWPGGPGGPGGPDQPDGSNGPGSLDSPGAPDSPGGPDWRPDGGKPRRTRRTALLSVSGVVVVVTAAGFASGLFSYEPPTRDGAEPKDVRQSVPDVPTRTSSASSPQPADTTAASPTPTSASPSASRSTAPSPPTSPSATTSASPSSPSPSGTAEPTQTAATVRATATTNPAPTLSLGDKGREVTELQLRLRELYLFTGDADGRYDDQVESAVRDYQWTRGITQDDSGVYGPETRARLESETEKP